MASLSRPRQHDRGNSSEQTADECATSTSTSTSASTSASTPASTIGSYKDSHDINSRSVAHNATLSSYEFAKPRIGATIAPSPSPPPIHTTHNPPHPVSSNVLSSSTSSSSSSRHIDPHTLQPNLKLQTDITSNTIDAHDSNSSMQKFNESKPLNIAISRTPSLKQVIANSYGSAPNSAISSPMLAGLTDITPLPSPLMSHDSPGPWRKLAARKSSKEHLLHGGADTAYVTSNGESISSAILNQPKRKAYHGLVSNISDEPQELVKASAGHQKNRSISEFVPDVIHSPSKARPHAVSGSFTIPESQTDTQMRREPHLAVKRGIAPIPRPPTPPSSRAGLDSDESDSSTHVNPFRNANLKSRFHYFDAYTMNDQKRRRWRSLRLLGEGTFSKVMLATSQASTGSVIHEDDVFAISPSTENEQPEESEKDRRKLVAIKICEHGPKGGATEERIEMSLKRELEIMKSIHHPSLVHLTAWSIEETRALLVMSYCPGGDLFDVASQHRDLLVPGLLKRILAELVGAIQFLHERHIVHRDIKLENVLVNLTSKELAETRDWATYPYSVTTLTDLGLSRRVADDEKLTTRCGSDDYAAPEVIMGQPYDGRAIDAWSLGVLVYALLEARLPFDPTPGMPDGHKQRSKTSHRIARVEWCWVEYAGDDGDHEGDVTKFENAGLRGAMDVTEGLLKRARSRWTVEKVADLPWIREAIAVDGGIRFREEDTPDEIV